MEPTTTDNLLKQLLSAHDLDDFLAANENVLSSISLSEYLEALLSSKGRKKADVIRDAQLDTVYGYQIFQGLKTAPSRDKLLQLAFGLTLNLQETQKLLRVGQAGALYAKNRRDSIIIYALEHQKSILQLNELLEKEGERLLL